MSAPLLVVGDSLLDRDVDGHVERLSPEGPAPVLDEDRGTARPGGAALAAALAASCGRPVSLITALGSDAPGAELRSLLGQAGVDVVDLGLRGPTPEKVRFRCDGRVLLRLDRNADGGTSLRRTATDAADAFGPCGGVLVSDYGRGLAADRGVRRLLAEAARSRPLVWDPHPLGGAPVRGARLATPNATEAARLDSSGPGGRDGLARRAALLAERWGVEAVAVTLGPAGALLVAAGASPSLFPARPAPGGDPCGAGDRFAAEAAGLLADGALLDDAVRSAVWAASAFVAGGGAGAFPAAAEPVPEESAEALVARVRAEGGTVVATGGCFDLLHAGHVRMLEAARALGDCLVVCLNSDESVRRLKGGGRPVVPEEDRAALLLALGCVDGVVLFDEDTPVATLERLRPNVFAKGGDYALDELPEARALATWGGEAVVLPYEEGRSTTRLLEEVLQRAG